MTDHNTDILPGKTAQQLSPKDIAVSSTSKIATVHAMSEMFSDEGRSIVAEALILLQEQLIHDIDRRKDKEMVERFLDHLFDQWAEKRMGITR